MEEEEAKGKGQPWAEKEMRKWRVQGLGFGEEEEDPWFRLGMEEGER